MEQGEGEPREITQTDHLNKKLLGTFSLFVLCFAFYSFFSTESFREHLEKNPDFIPQVEESNDDADEWK
jgi:hypothetical protein